MPSGDNEKLTKISIERLERLLRALASSFRMELTNETSKIYIAALMEVSVEILQIAIIDGVRRWRFFPSVAEILDAVDQCQAKLQGHDRAYSKLVERYEQAYLAGWQPPQLKSVTEDDVKRIAGEVLTHEERLMLGIDEPRQLTPQEFDSRMRELERQKQELFGRQKPEGPEV